MTKTELAQKVSDFTGAPERAVNLILDTAKESIINALLNGEVVALKGFGTFALTHYAERPGTNPMTGQRIVIPPHNTITFKAAQKLKDAVK